MILYNTDLAGIQNIALGSVAQNGVAIGSETPLSEFRALLGGLLANQSADIIPTAEFPENILNFDEMLSELQTVLFSDPDLSAFSDKVMQRLSELFGEYFEAFQNSGDGEDYNAIMTYIADIIAALGESATPEISSETIKLEFKTAPINEVNNNSVKSEIDTADFTQHANQGEKNVHSEDAIVSDSLSFNTERAPAEHDSQLPQDLTTTYSAVVVPMSDTEDVLSDDVAVVTDSIDAQIGKNSRPQQKNEIEPTPQVISPETQVVSPAPQATLPASEIAPQLSEEIEIKIENTAREIMDKITFEAEKEFNVAITVKDSETTQIKTVHIVKIKADVVTEGENIEPQDVQSDDADELREKVAFYRNFTESNPNFKRQDEIKSILSELKKDIPTQPQSDEIEENPEKSINTVFNSDIQIREAFTNKPNSLAEPKKIPPAIQISDEITAKVKELGNGVTEFDIKLAPEELGKVSIKLVTTGAKVAVEIIAERPETAEMLKGKINDLSDALKQNNTQLEKYEVCTENETSNQQSYLNRENKGGGQQNQNENKQKREEPVETAEAVSFADLIQSMAYS